MSLTTNLISGRHFPSVLLNPGFVFRISFNSSFFVLFSRLGFVKNFGRRTLPQTWCEAPPPVSSFPPPRRTQTSNTPPDFNRFLTTPSADRTWLVSPFDLIRVSTILTRFPPAARQPPVFLQVHWWKIPVFDLPRWEGCLRLKKKALLLIRFFPSSIPPRFSFLESNLRTPVSPPPCSFSAFLPLRTEMFSHRNSRPSPPFAGLSIFLI